MELWRLCENKAEKSINVDYEPILEYAKGFVYFTYHQDRHQKYFRLCARAVPSYGTHG